MRALIVGAGAVGQVFGAHLAKGGVEVTLFVRPRTRDAAKAGFILHRLGLRGARTTRFDAHDVVSSIDELRARRFDQVWLCIASTALRGGDIAALLQATAPATIVCLQPAPEDGTWVRTICGDEARVVDGPIHMISYAAELPGDPVKGPGTRYLLPPVLHAFDGARVRADAVCKALRAGGVRARFQAASRDEYRRSAAISMPMLAALELEGWSIDALQRSVRLPTALSAARQNLEIAARAFGGPVPWLRALLRPWLVSVALALVRRILPIPLESFLRYHFTKVGDQTQLILEEYVALSQRFALPATATESLRTELKQVRHRPRS